MTSMPRAGLPKLLNAGADGLIASEGRIDGGLSDVHLGGKPVWPVVDILMAQGIPLLLATGYNSGHPEGSCVSPFLRETSP